MNITKEQYKELLIEITRLNIEIEELKRKLNAEPALHIDYRAKRKINTPLRG